MGFVLPTIAALRCGRAPPSRPCYRDLAAATDARARRYLAYGAVLGVREVLLLHDSVRQVYSYMPFRNHADIVVFLWLQLPVFQGLSPRCSCGRGVIWRSWRTVPQGLTFLVLCLCLVGGVTGGGGYGGVLGLRRRATAGRACSR